MYRQLLKSKIHRATVTDANLHYEGSITVDWTLMEAADLVPYERVQVLNVYNGARFETYVIPGEPGSGEVCVNGAAARLVHPGDLVLILSYLWLEEQAARSYKPKIVHVDEKNRILVPTQS